jgi:hypothetical protein
MNELLPSNLPSWPPTPNRRGAPSGNTNAIKHGFYARHFKKKDMDDLEKSSLGSVADEIALLRVFTRRVVELGIHVEDLSQAVDLLRVLCLASSSLNRLLRTQKLLAPEENDEVGRAISEALSEVMQEFNIGTHV